MTEPNIKSNGEISKKNKNIYESENFFEFICEMENNIVKIWRLKDSPAYNFYIFLFM